MGSQPQKILLVELMLIDVPEGDRARYKLLGYACELLTKKGYVIRREAEFVRCKVCSRAIPSERLYSFMNNKEIRTLPLVWSNTCSTC